MRAKSTTTLSMVGFTDGAIGSGAGRNVVESIADFPAVIACLTTESLTSIYSSHPLPLAAPD